MLRASEFGRTVYEARSSCSELCRNPLDIRQAHSPVILETGDLLLELRDSRCLRRQSGNSRCLCLQSGNSRCLLAKSFEFCGADGNDLRKRLHLNILFVILHTHVTSNEHLPGCLSFPMIFSGAP